MVNMTGLVGMTKNDNTTHPPPPNKKTMRPHHHHQTTHTTTTHTTPLHKKQTTHLRRQRRRQIQAIHRRRAHHPPRPSHPLPPTAIDPALLPTGPPLHLEGGLLGREEHGAGKERARGLPARHLVLFLCFWGFGGVERSLLPAFHLVCVCFWVLGGVGVCGYCFVGYGYAYIYIRLCFVCMPTIRLLFPLPPLPITPGSWPDAKPPHAYTHICIHIYTYVPT